jgi:hypothetical protein
MLTARPGLPAGSSQIDVGLCGTCASNKRNFDAVFWVVKRISVVKKIPIQTGKTVTAENR